MASNYDALYQLAGVGSQMGTKLPNKAGSRMGAEERPKRMRRDENNVSERLNWPARSLDPIQRLPPEISTVVINDALGSNTVDRLRILELTHVSQTWQRFLLFTPVLWSEIYINNRRPDLLATVATFVHLSCKAVLKIILYVGTMFEWADLAPILAPACQRITSLTVMLWPSELGSDIGSQYFSATSAFFDHVGRPARLQELHIPDPQYRPNITFFDSLELTSTIALTCRLGIPIPRSIQSSATPGRFFDMNKYISFGPVLLMEPLFHDCGIYLPHSTSQPIPEGCELIVFMREETLSHLQYSNEYIQRHAFLAASSNSPNSNSNALWVTEPAPVDPAPTECGLEQFTHAIGASLCHLVVEFDLSQVNELVNFLRLLTHLQVLDLRIINSGVEGPTEIAASKAVVHQLQRLFVTHTSRYIPSNSEGLLRKLFLRLKALYPNVKELSFSGAEWPFFASSYLASLNTLKSLRLTLFDTRYGSRHDTLYHPENYSITLRSLENLVVSGQPLLHCLRMPNLLSLRLEEMTSNVDLQDLDLPSLRKLAIYLNEGGSYSLDPLDYSGLCELDLGVSEALDRVDILSFCHLSSIRLETHYFTNPEGNHLCTALLYYPEGCPMLQELHLEKCLEWDILFLMLERRNFGLKGIKRIHTVTLPFIPSIIHQTFLLLLAGEYTERPPLESLSLEETREVLFDPTVQGCFNCLKNMIPGCVKNEVCEQKDPERSLWSADMHYPEHKYMLDTVPRDIQDWMVHRKDLVGMWKSSYSKFHQEFIRVETCGMDTVKTS